MKRRVPIGSFPLGLAVSFACCLISAQAQETTLVQGEIVDLPCYMATVGHGAGYQACALLCAKKTVPIGVLSDAGELFLLLTESNNPEPYEAARQLAGSRAELTGKLIRKRGVASLIVESVEER